MRIVDVLLLLATPVIVFWFVQMITWLSGYKNKAVGTIRGLFTMSLNMNQPYLAVNLAVYAAFFVLLILICRKVNLASAALCYLLVIMAMVNYFVMEFRG